MLKYSRCSHIAPYLDILGLILNSVGSSIEQLDARSCSLGKLHARARSVLEKTIFLNVCARSMLELYARKCSTSNFYIDLAVVSPYIAY